MTKVTVHVEKQKQKKGKFEVCWRKEQSEVEY